MLRLEILESFYAKIFILDEILKSRKQTREVKINMGWNVFSSSPPYFWRHRVSLNLELTDSAGLAFWGTPATACLLNT